MGILVWVHRILLNSERQLAELYQYPEQKKSSKDKRKKAVAILTETIMNYLKLDKMLMRMNEVNAEELMTIRRLAELHNN